MSGETIAPETTNENQQTPQEVVPVEAKPNEQTDELKGPSASEQRYKQDMLKYKDKLAVAEQSLADQRKDKLVEQGAWEQLAKDNEQRALAAESRASDLESGIKYDRKISAVKTLAMSSGLRNEALADLELLQFDEVELELTSTGRVNVLGADRAVERLKQTRPHWFSGRKASINSGDPGVVVSSSEVKYADLVKVEALAVKSGDYTEYKSMLLKFREQQSSR